MDQAQLQQLALLSIRQLTRFTDSAEIAILELQHEAQQRFKKNLRDPYQRCVCYLREIISNFDNFHQTGVTGLIEEAYDFLKSQSIMLTHAEVFECMLELIHMCVIKQYKLSINFEELLAQIKLNQLHDFGRCIVLIIFLTPSKKAVVQQLPQLLNQFKQLNHVEMRLLVNCILEVYPQITLFDDGGMILHQTLAITQEKQYFIESEKLLKLFKAQRSFLKNGDVQSFVLNLFQAFAKHNRTTQKLLVEMISENTYLLKESFCDMSAHLQSREEHVGIYASVLFVAYLRQVDEGTIIGQREQIQSLIEIVHERLASNEVQNWKYQAYLYDCITAGMVLYGDDLKNDVLLIDSMILEFYPDLRNSYLVYLLTYIYYNKQLVEKIQMNVSLIEKLEQWSLQQEFYGETCKSILALVSQ